MDQVQTEQQTSMPADIAEILQAETPQATPPAEQPFEAVPQTPPIPAAPAAPPQPHMVPLSELLDTRHRAQEAERIAREASERFAQLQRELEARFRPQPEPIDPIANPEAAWDAVGKRIAASEQRAQEMAVHSRANMSEMLARSKHGDAAVEAAREAAVKAGLGTHFLQQANPYESLMEWDRGQKAAKEIGDPAAYKEKLKAEILAELKGAVPPRPGQPPQVLPPSLSTATRASVPNPLVQDTGDFFKTMFAKPQRT